MRAFRVCLPDGSAYWTVLDDAFTRVLEVDRFLSHLRFGRDRAEGTTREYARALVLFFAWCERSGHRWEEAPSQLSSFITWLRYTPSGSGGVVLGPGVPPARSPRRINFVLTVVREFFKHAVAVGQLSADVLCALYEVADDRRLPAAHHQGPPLWGHRARRAAPARPRRRAAPALYALLGQRRCRQAGPSTAQSGRRPQRQARSGVGKDKAAVAAAFREPRLRRGRQGWDESPRRGRPDVRTR